MFIRALLTLVVLFGSSYTHAWELEAFAGANVTTYDEVEEANSHGISARAKVNFYRDNKGVFLNMNWQGIHLMAGDFLVGYAKRSRDAWFLEAGAGLAYSEIWGPGYGLLASTGYRFNRGLFLNFPLIYRGGAQTLLFWSPYIGMEF